MIIRGVYYFLNAKIGVLFFSKIKYSLNVAPNPHWLTKMGPNPKLLFG
jgi:hypothetical protein